MRFTASLVIILACAATFFTAEQSFAAVVNYSGVLYDFFGVPVQGGRVVAGTFKPGFDVATYSCTYGDFACNLDSDNYSQAVADGNFLPLNSGVLTDSVGFFSGNGISTAVGSQIYLFGFPGSQPISIGEMQALGTGTTPSFFVPATLSTTVDAAQANQFVFGSHFGNGIRLGVVPFPEPSSCGLAVMAVAAVTARGARRRSVERA